MLLWHDVNDPDTVVIGDVAKFQRNGENVERYSAWSSMHIDGISDLLGGDAVEAVKRLKNQPAGTAVEVQVVVLRVDGEDVSGCETAARQVAAARGTADGLKREVAGREEIRQRMLRVIEKKRKLIEVYEWLFEHNSCVGRDSALREDGQVWVVYDVDGDVVSRGRDSEEAAWGAWDLAHTRV